MDDKQKIYLIDGSSYIYRAFFAIRDLKTSHGVPTNAVYGFMQMVAKILRELSPVYLAVVLDARGPTFRHMVYEHYKANRPEMPERLRPQVPKIKEILAAYRIAVLEREGYEADDIIGTLAVWLEAQGYHVVIVSGDKDLLQLVTPNVRVWDTMYDRHFDQQAVRTKYGVGSDQLPDVFGLMGDSSDNIPGVPGIGEKRATALIQQFGALENLLEHLDDVEPKSMAQALGDHTDQALLSKRLAVIDRRVPIEVSLETLQHGPADTARLRALFKELEFHRLLQELGATAGVQEVQCRVLETEEDCKKCLEGFREVGSVALALLTERSASDAPGIRGVALAGESGKACYVPLLGPDGAVVREGPGLQALRRILQDSSVGKIGHDLKRAKVLLAREAEIELNGFLEDTMVASYLLNPSRRTHELEALALEVLDLQLTPEPRERDGAAEGETAGGMLPRQAQRACAMADAAVRLRGRLTPRLVEEGFEKLFKELEVPLIPVLARMEMHGVRVDVEELEALGEVMAAEMRGLEEEIHAAAGTSFNINSPQQLAVVLFETLKLPVLRRTKTGYSTSMEVLQELARGHDLPRKVLEYRSVAKLKSTYVDVLPRLVDPRTGRIHTYFNQTVTATGRLSSSEPNLQNIPIRGELGQRIRRAFVPDDGHIFLSADYSQVELRIMACLSGDPILLESFRRNEDIHVRTAAEIFGVSPEEITTQMRREAKVINFGILYGMSAFGLARELNVSSKVARAYIDGYFQRYKGVRDYIDGVLEEAGKKGYVETLMGRRRYLPEIVSANVAARKFAERTAINTPIQGTAADIIKMAMIRVQRALDKARMRTRMIIQVHDELLFEVPAAEKQQLAELVKEEMESVVELQSPLRVELGWGQNWAEAH
jgi:DNA polymerase-1